MTSASRYGPNSSKQSSFYLPTPDHALRDFKVILRSRHPVQYRDRFIRCIRISFSQVVPMFPIFHGNRYRLTTRTYLRDTRQLTGC
jgi:hypothetical protein